MEFGACIVPKRVQCEIIMGLYIAGIILLHTPISRIRQHESTWLAATLTGCGGGGGKMRSCITHVGIAKV